MKYQLLKTGFMILLASYAAIVHTDALLAWQAGIKYTTEGVQTRNNQNLTAQKSPRKVSRDVENLQERFLYLRQRSFSKDRKDLNALQAAGIHNLHMLQIESANKTTIFPPGETWECIGPFNLYSTLQIYNGTQELSGRVSSIAYGRKGGQKIIYIATAAGGVWKSTNGGTDWSFLSLSWPSLRVSSIAVSSADADVIYAGTGDFDEVGYYGFGIQKSLNGGKSWQTLPTPVFNNTKISRILIDPEDPKIVLVATGRGDPWQGKIWRSDDAGQTWNEAQTGDHSALSSIAGKETAWSDMAFGVLDRSNEKRYYYAAGHYNAFLRSDDRGKTWQDLTAHLPAKLRDAGSFAGTKIATSPSKPATVYLLSGSAQAILKSNDSGGHWMDITGNFNDSWVDSGEWSQADYDLHLTCSETGSGAARQDVLYAGLITLHQSLGGGRVWTDLGLSQRFSAHVHSDEHCMAIDPEDSNKALIGTDGGLYEVTYDPATQEATFTSLNKPLTTTLFYKAAFHPHDPNFVLGGTQDNGVIAASSTDPWRIILSGDGGSCAINPVHDNYQYAASSVYHSFYVTSDGWKTYQTFYDWGDDTVSHVPPIVVDPNSPNTIYYGTNYLWRYDQDTGAWQEHLGNIELAQSFPEDPGYVQAIAIAPSDSYRIYTGSNHGELWMSADRGNTWTRLDTGSTLPVACITSIDVDPTDPNSILVGYASSQIRHLWRCKNTLDTKLQWEDIGGTADAGLPDISLNTIARHYNDPQNQIFVGTDIGVYYTPDGGDNWINVTTKYGLPNVQVNELKAVPGTGYLNAATYGRGIWHIRLGPGTQPLSKGTSGQAPAKKK